MALLVWFAAGECAHVNTPVPAVLTSPAVVVRLNVCPAATVRPALAVMRPAAVVTPASVTVNVDAESAVLRTTNAVPAPVRLRVNRPFVNVADPSAALPDVSNVMRAELPVMMEKGWAEEVPAKPALDVCWRSVETVPSVALTQPARLEPWTVRPVAGAVVPTPTLPSASITKGVESA